MKITEMIDLLEAELYRLGDVEVILHGTYGAAETTFEVIPKSGLTAEMLREGKLHIWTGIHTG